MRCDVMAVNDRIFCSEMMLSATFVFEKKYFMLLTGNNLCTFQLAAGFFCIPLNLEIRVPFWAYHRIIKI